MNLKSDLKMDFQMVICDMDGTLLDAEGQVPETFWDVAKQLQERGIIFAPASGRQLDTLLQLFGQIELSTVIAENGTVLYHDGKVIDTTPVDREVAHAIITAVEERDDVNWGVVLCRSDGALSTRTDDQFLEEVTKYYLRHSTVDDLHAEVNDQVVKLAIVCFDGAEQVAFPLLQPHSGDLQTVVAGPIWVDILNAEMNKGIALQRLCALLDIDQDKTLAFGDYLNDLELVQAAGTSYAMDNGHQRVKEAATFVAPANTEDGVVRILTKLLAQDTES